MHEREHYIISQHRHRLQSILPSDLFNLWHKTNETYIKGCANHVWPAEIELVEKYKLITPKQRTEFLFEADRKVKVLAERLFRFSMDNQEKISQWRTKNKAHWDAFWIFTPKLSSSADDGYNSCFVECYHRCGFHDPAPNTKINMYVDPPPGETRMGIKEFMVREVINSRQVNLFKPE